MANFVRDGVALEIPEAQLSLLKVCFDKTDAENQKLQEKLNALETYTIDGKKYLADMNVIQEIQKLLTQVGDYGKKMNDNEEEMMAKAQELEALRAQIEELKAKEEVLMKELEEAKSSEPSEEEMMDRVAKRRDLERKVAPILNCDEAELGAKSDRVIKQEVLMQRYSYNVDELTGKSDEAINAMFDIAVKQAQAESASNKTFLPKPEMIEDSVNKLKNAYQQHIEEVENAWKHIIK